jgi:hypothetical protein
MPLVILKIRLCSEDKYKSREIKRTGKALGYKPESRGFETRRGGILNLPNPSGRTRPWGLRSL